MFLASWICLSLLRVFTYWYLVLYFRMMSHWVTFESLSRLWVTGQVLSHWVFFESLSNIWFTELWICYYWHLIWLRVWESCKLMFLTPWFCLIMLWVFFFWRLIGSILAFLSHWVGLESLSRIWVTVQILSHWAGFESLVLAWATGLDSSRWVE